MFSKISSKSRRVIVNDNYDFSLDEKIEVNETIEGGNMELVSICCTTYNHENI